MVGIVRPADEHPLRVETVEGTGYLVAGGRGLGITARHVAAAVLAAAPIPDLSVGISPTAEVRVPLVGFPGADGFFRSAAIVAFDLHPTEDVALFRLPDDDYFSPYTINTSQHFGGPNTACGATPTRYGTTTSHRTNGR
jgi:hypothetical protein